MVDSTNTLFQQLVQMGKALKVANRDGQKGAGQYTQNLEQRLSISNRVFHVALDEIESEIVGGCLPLLIIFMRSHSSVIFLDVDMNTHPDRGKSSVIT